MCVYVCACVCVYIHTHTHTHCLHADAPGVDLLTDELLFAVEHLGLFRVDLVLVRRVGRVALVFAFLGGLALGALLSQILESQSP